ncbi:MAG: hypothetical protein ACE5FT_00340 [Candidatus Nanoarchaeia archaeon]
MKTRLTNYALPLFIAAAASAQPNMRIFTQSQIEEGLNDFNTCMAKFNEQRTEATNPKDPNFSATMIHQGEKIGGQSFTYIEHYGADEDTGAPRAIVQGVFVYEGNEKYHTIDLRVGVLFDDGWTSEFRDLDTTRQGYAFCRLRKPGENNKRELVHDYGPGSFMQAPSIVLRALGDHIMDEPRFQAHFLDYMNSIDDKLLTQE